MKSYKILILSILLFQNCSKPECEVAPEVQDFFSTQFDEIQTCLNRTNIVSGKALLAISYLERITAIKSSVEYGDVSYYESKKDYRVDRRKWNKWYEENKCELSARKIDSVKKELDALSRTLLKND